MSEAMENKDLNTVVAAEQDNITKYLTFISDKLHFCVDTNNVVEILTNQFIRPFPMVPPYVKGVINLRGQVIPVIDLRLRIGKMPLEDSEENCIIVLEIASDTIGIIVDTVAQVIDINENDISMIPTESRQELTKYMTTDEHGTVIMLLECETLIEEYM